MFSRLYGIVYLIFLRYTVNRIKECRLDLVH